MGKFNWFDWDDKTEAYKAVRIEQGGNPAHVAAYMESLMTHIRHVQTAGLQIGLGIEDVALHDASKWLDEEFLAAAEHWHGGAPNPDRYARAWLHHIHYNPHHWQHWIFSDGFVPRGSSVENGVMEMPPRYALEMIADWMGSSMAYTGSWNMDKWLYENMPRIRLHSKTAAYVRGQLDMQGYADVVFMQRWAHEV